MNRFRARTVQIIKEVKICYKFCRKGDHFKVTNCLARYFFQLSDELEFMIDEHKQIRYKMH